MYPRKPWDRSRLVYWQLVFILSCFSATFSTRKQIYVVKKSKFRPNTGIKEVLVCYSVLGVAGSR